MIENCCAFTGHRPNRFSFRYDETAPLCQKIKAALMEQAEHCYQAGARTYWTGGALGVDLWAAEVVAALKRQHRDMILHCAVPFPGHDRTWPSASQRRLARVLSACDEVVTISNEYQADAYRRRNHFMVDRCQTLIAVFDQTRNLHSGTFQTVNYAQKLQRRIIFIHPDNGAVTAVRLD